MISLKGNFEATDKAQTIVGKANLVTANLYVLINVTTGVVSIDGLFAQGGQTSIGPLILHKGQSTVIQGWYVTVTGVADGSGGTRYAAGTFEACIPG